MNNDAKNRSFRMPLIEIIIVVAVFVLISVLLLRLYVSADGLQSSAENMSHAVVLVQSMGETIKGCDSIDEAIAELKLTQNANGEYEYYNSGVNVIITFSEEELASGKIISADIRAESEKSEDLCNITVKEYINKDAGVEE